MRWPWQPREVVTSPSREDRIRNEIQCLIAIRDDGLRVQPGSQLHTWINGSIFALEWSVDPHTTAAKPPSAVAALIRSGLETL
jgi:hypothetical protein